MGVIIWVKKGCHQAILLREHMGIFHLTHSNGTEREREKICIQPKRKMRLLEAWKTRPSQCLMPFLLYRIWCIKRVTTKCTIAAYVGHKCTYCIARDWQIYKKKLEFCFPVSIFLFLSCFSLVLIFLCLSSKERSFVACSKVSITRHLLILATIIFPAQTSPTTTLAKFHMTQLCSAKLN